VLQSLFRFPDLSRADLARLTELTPATISQLVGELIDEGLVEAAGRGPAKVGKPPTPLRLVSDSRHLVCVDLSDTDAFRAAVVDMAGKVVHRESVDRGDATGEHAVELVGGLIQATLAATTKPVLGIGLGTPGVVDAAGTVVEAVYLDWFDVPLRQLMARRFDLPVHVCNDANTAVLAEYSFGEETGTNLMVIKVGPGIGAGLLVDGRPHLGENFSAGEIGHIIVDEDGPPCRCGKRGCLESFIAVPELRSALAHAADPQQVRAEAGQSLGVVLAAAVSILDIHEIVLAGPSDLLDEAFREAALETIRARTLASLSRSDAVRIRHSTLGDDIVLLGAGVLVLSQELGVA
jgi:predicted NBD/HSP70 family sugar kinase